MPKRSTLTYTSEDGTSRVAEQLHVYYCSYSSKPAFVIDCKIERLPKRKTDNATIIDTERHLLKLYTTDGAMKLIRRRNGKVERQLRLHIGILPIAYRSEENGRYVYIMDQAVSAFATGQTFEATGPSPVPPCIIQTDADGCQITVEVEDKATKTSLRKISADAVRISIISSISQEQANDEIIKLFGKILGCRSTQLTITKSPLIRTKTITVQGLDLQEVYDKIQSAKPVENIRPIDIVSEVMNHE